MTDDGLLGGDTDESELVQCFDNLVTFAEYNLDKWQESKDDCNASRVECKVKDEHCDKVIRAVFRADTLICLRAHSPFRLKKSIAMSIVVLRCRHVKQMNLGWL